MELVSKWAVAKATKKVRVTRESKAERSKSKKKKKKKKKIERKIYRKGKE